MPDTHSHSSKSWQEHEITTNPSISPIIAFNVLQILGLIIISVTLCTALFSSRIRKSMAWFSSTFSWGLSTIGYLLIIGHQTGPSPDPILCLFQSMLIYALIVLRALTFTVLVFEVFLCISCLNTVSRTTMITLYFVPYGVFAGMLIIAYILGRLDPRAVRRGPFGMYCHIATHTLTLITSTIVILCMIVCLILGARIVLTCSRQQNSKTLLTHNRTSFNLFQRLCIIFIFSVLLLGLTLTHMIGQLEFLVVCTDIALAALPLGVGILFASQKDILCVLLFWRKPPQALPTTSVISLKSLGSSASDG